MERTVQLKLSPSESADQKLLRSHIAEALGVSTEAITGYYIIRQSIDARSRQPWIILSIRVYVDEAPIPRSLSLPVLNDVGRAKKTVVIIGAGPAGLFAALKLIERGIRPVIVERGKEIRARRRDLAALNREGIINSESNYCFGEGGAGTYSDGKLYTRSSKRGDIYRILSIFVNFGATENILYDAHPHIGTNKLPQIIAAMRNKIIECGGEILFDKKVSDFHIESGVIKTALTADGDVLSANAFILATGHSARDIFELLHNKEIAIEFKPFALGVRIEHPQSLIDDIQYHLRRNFNTSNASVSHDFLPPASYSLVEQVDERGVFSFCMCPGGIIAPAATSDNEIVVNGWSPSKRNNPYANSGIVVNIEEKDIAPFRDKGSLAGMYFQRSVEQRAFAIGGGRFVAPAQRMADFTSGKLSATLPDCSYQPGVHSSQVAECFPPFLSDALRKAFMLFGKKMKGYLTNEAIVLATESRTSSPVRIPRLNDKLCHPQLANLYPCGEGAGFAGGIVSAAMDGEKVAESIALAMH